MKKTRRMRLVISVVSFLIIGNLYLSCASSGNTSKANVSEIVVTRLSHNPAADVSIFLDGQPKGKIKSGETKTFKIPDGDHKLMVDTNAYGGYSDDTDFTANSSRHLFSIELDNKYEALFLWEKGVIQLSNPNKNSSNNQNTSSTSGTETALNKAAENIMQRIQKSDRIAIINVASNDKSLSEFISEELEFILVKNNFVVVDRNQLDRIRNEQKFQLSGEVDDASAVSIGKFAGAKVVLVSNISGSGDLRRLRIRALDTQTAQVIGAASEPF